MPLREPAGRLSAEAPGERVAENNWPTATPPVYQAARSALSDKPCGDLITHVHY
jgi:hypothetical protein